jgi:ribosomal protein L37AE/L43A
MVRCEECNRNKIETKGKIYECPECGMTVCARAARPSFLAIASFVPLRFRRSMPGKR